MGSKTFFASKLNWLGMLTVIASIVQKYGNVLPAAWLPYAAAAAGIATILLRTFGTSTAISLPGSAN